VKITLTIFNREGYCLIVRCLMSYAGVVRYPDGGGLHAAEARWEQVFLAAAESATARAGHPC
jgi:hypothetical protein